MAVCMTKSMMVVGASILIALGLISEAVAFFGQNPRPSPMQQLRYYSDVVALSPGKPNIGKGGTVLQKPGLQTQARTAPPKRKEKRQEKVETQEDESERFAVVLHGDKDADQGHVVKVLCKVIAGLGAIKAVAAFEEAQLKGKAIVLICDEELAETIAELVSRNKPPVICDVEPLRKDL